MELRIVCNTYSILEYYGIDKSNSYTLQPQADNFT